MLQQLFKVDDAHEFKPILAEIEDAPVSPLARVVLWLILITMVFFAGWLYFGKVDVVVSARGKVLPVGHVKDLAPLDTGVVRSILVEEGDRVKKGQVLMEIDPSSIEPEVESTAKNLNYARLEMERLNATLGGRSFRPAAGGGDAEAVATQHNLYASNMAELSKQLETKQAELSKVEEEINATQVERSQNKSMLATAKAKEARLAPVLDIVARDEYDQVERDIVTYSNGMEQASYKLEELAHRRRQILQEIDYTRQNFRSTHLRELTDRQKTATDLAARLKEYSFRNARQQIVSPVDGYVDKLLVHTVGGVVKPAEAV
ncbi:MAG: biotin/lipoyl-binding protein, partial [Chloroflexi bacterium]|nr:biotin/lipoyl-binding protein [Chloroflexota bacterium]